MSLCLKFIIICFLLLFTIFLLLYKVGTSIILDCLLNQRFVYLLPGLIMGSLTFVSRWLFWNNIEASLKILLFHKFKCSLKSLLLRHKYYIIYTSSFLQSIRSEIFFFFFFFFFCCRSLCLPIFYDYICASLNRLFSFNLDVKLFILPPS